MVTLYTLRMVVFSRAWRALLMRGILTNTLVSRKEMKYIPSLNSLSRLYVHNIIYYLCRCKRLLFCIIATKYFVFPFHGILSLPEGSLQHFTHIHLHLYLAFLQESNFLGGWGRQVFMSSLPTFVISPEHFEGCGGQCQWVRRGQPCSPRIQWSRWLRSICSVCCPDSEIVDSFPACNFSLEEVVSGNSTALRGAFVVDCNSKYSDCGTLFS